MSETEVPPNTPTRARLIPQHRQPEIEVYVLGEGMADMLAAAAWIASRAEGYEVPFCDDTGLLLRSKVDDEFTYNEWLGVAEVMIWSPPGTPNGGLFGTVGKSYLDDYEVIAPDALRAEGTTEPGGEG